MKQILVQIDDTTAKLLDKIAPGSSRKRSKFIRDAVIRALMDVLEVETERAYRRNARFEEPYVFHPEEWAPESEAIHPPRRRRRRR